MANRIFVITPMDMEYSEYHSYVDSILSHAQKNFGHCRLVWTREVKDVKPGNHPLLNITAILNRVKCYEAFYRAGNSDRQDAVSNTLCELFRRLDRPVFVAIHDNTNTLNKTNKKKKKEKLVEDSNQEEDKEEFFIEDDEEYPNEYSEKESFLDGVKKKFKKFVGKED